MSGHSIYTFKWNEMRKLYTAKAEKKGRSADEVDEIICWHTGHTKKSLAALGEDVDMVSFFEFAPALNPSRVLIKGSVCGVKIEEIDRTDYEGNSLS